MPRRLLISLHPSLDHSSKLPNSWNKRLKKAWRLMEHLWLSTIVSVKVCLIFTFICSLVVGEMASRVSFHPYNAIQMMQLSDLFKTSFVLLLQECNPNNASAYRLAVCVI